MASVWKTPLSAICRAAAWRLTPHTSYLHRRLLSPCSMGSRGRFQKGCESLPKAEEPCLPQVLPVHRAGPAGCFPAEKAVSCHPAPDHPRKGQCLEEVQPRVRVAVPVHTQAALARFLLQLQGLRFVSGWLEVVERFCGRSGSSSQFLAPEPQSIRGCACRTLELCFIFFPPNGTDFPSKTFLFRSTFAKCSGCD